MFRRNGSDHVAVKRAGAALFTGEQYQQNLTRALEEIKVSAEAFVSQATMSLHHRVTLGMCH